MGLLNHVQLYFINCTFHTFIQCRQFPLVYVLIHGKRRTLYDYMFKMLKEAYWNRNYHLNPSKVISDFENSLVSLIALQFIGAKNKNCYYHLSQVICAKVLNLEYRNYYLSDGKWDCLCKYIISFYKINDGTCIPSFQALCEDKPEDLDIDDFIEDYMNRTWIYRRKLWSIFDCNGPRTNNHHLEGWHYKLNSFYQLMEIIKNEQVVELPLKLKLCNWNPPKKKRMIFRLNLG